jgi:hypothetical protein
MATEFDMVLFEQHLAELRALPNATRWRLERGSPTLLEVHVDMHPRTAPSERFRARLRWQDYSKPFSLKFIDPETGRDDDPRAWPIFQGSRPASLDACVPYTEEGVRLHPEWQASPTNAYKAPESPLQFAVLTLQNLLDNTYGGRGGR